MQLFAGWLSLCQAPRELSAGFGEPGRNGTRKGSVLLWVTQPDPWGPTPGFHVHVKMWMRFSSQPSGSQPEQGATRESNSP